jgi:alginate export protein
MKAQCNGPQLTRTGERNRAMQSLRLALVTVLFVIVASVSALAQTQARNETKPTKDTKPPCPKSEPSFPQMTYDEDNRYLSNPACRKEFWDRLKYIPLRPGHEDYYLSFGGSARVRGEYFSHPNWGSGPPGSSYLLQRYYVHADLHLGTRFRFFTELGSSLEHGRTGGPRSGSDQDKLDVHQAFIDIGLWRSGKNRLTLRPGRQEIAFGDESLIGVRDGPNIRRSFDGVRLTGKLGNWTGDAFAVRQSKSKPGFFDDSLDHTTSLWGLYVVRPIKYLPGGHVDLYYMGFRNKRAVYDRGAGKEQRETLGARLWGRGEHFDYNQEYSFQFGRFRSDDIRAWAVNTETGYRFDSILFKPRLGLNAGAYSGDNGRSGGSLGTFNGIYEKSTYFTYAALFGRRNLMDLQPNVQINLPRNITVTPNAAFYWRESIEDGLYSSGSGPVSITGRKSSARYIGSQVAVQVKWKVDRHITVFGEYLHFFPGDFLRQSTPGRNLNYTTYWAEYRF